MPRKPKPLITAQQPKLGPISFQDFQWTTKTRKGFGKMLTFMAAYLPLDRIEDFIAGQTCADGFTVEWIVVVRVRGVQVGRPQIDSYIEHVHYQCAFGPKDHMGSRGCIAKFPSNNFFCFQI